MKTIWKYGIPARVTVLDMPSGAEILTIQMQGADLCLWALVDPAQSTETRKFHAYRTGDTAPDSAERYVGTALASDGSRVWHVFEEDFE